MIDLAVVSCSCTYLYNVIMELVEESETETLQRTITQGATRLVPKAPIMVVEERVLREEFRN
jgi:hypothetical protein